MVAPAAIQQGLRLQNIQRQLVDGILCRSTIRTGTVAIIGRNAAAAHVGKLTFAGFPAWILWLGFIFSTDRLS